MRFPPLNRSSNCFLCNNRTTRGNPSPFTSPTLMGCWGPAGVCLSPCGVTGSCDRSLSSSGPEIRVPVSFLIDLVGMFFSLSTLCAQSQRGYFTRKILFVNVMIPVNDKSCIAGGSFIGYKLHLKAAGRHYFHRGFWFFWTTMSTFWITVDPDMFTEIGDDPVL